MTSSEKQAHRQAARLSKTEGTQHVVWVFDQGRDVFNSDQMRRYAPLVQVEATYMAGVQISTEQVTA